MKNEKGQSLIEILLSLATMVVIITAITYAVISSLKNTEFGKDQNLATQYAQQGLELVRNMRNNDYATFSSLSGYYCLAKTCTTLSPNAGDPCGIVGALGCGQNVDNYVRQVSVQQYSTTCNNTGSRVEVSVAWTDSGCNKAPSVFCHNVTLVSCLTNINPVQTP